MTLKRISFIRPHIRAMRAADAMQPLAFAILAARTPASIKISFYDERLRDVPLDEDTDLVALSVETFTARRAYQIAAAYRQRGVPVVMGGYHPTLLPDEAERYCDAVCIGDAEGVWEQILADAARGELRSRYQQSGFPELDGPAPDRSIFAGKRYGPVMPVQYGRGCRYNCDFCSIRAFYGSTLRYRPLEQLVDEIRSQASRLVLLVDDNLFTDQARGEALCHALMPLGIRWASQISIDVAHNEQLVKLMARSGCVALLIGFESLNENNLGDMNKRWNLRGGAYVQAIRRLHRHGILVYASFMFGYDHDTLDVFERTSDFLIDNRLPLANFNLLTPTPGTPLYDRLDAENRLLYENWWLDPAYRYGQAPFQPKHMSTRELSEGCHHARMRYYALGSRLRGLLQPVVWRRPINLGLYVGANLIARREVLRKQRSSFGEN